MTIQERCSECGALLQTTNANPLHDEIERLRADWAEACKALGEARAENERLKAILARYDDLRMGTLRTS